MYLFGANFGPDASTLTARYSLPTPGSYVYLASCSRVSGSGDTQIVCSSAAGAGAGHVWVVTVDGQQSVPSTNSTSYRLPIITSITGGL